MHVPKRPPITPAIIAAFLAAFLVPTTGAVAVDGSKPTIVLVHGAFADQTSWSDVAPRLAKDGYTAVTPRLDLDSVAGDVANVRAELDGIEGDKILVGHSYGGFVISNAAAGRADVLGLVYSAGFMPDRGESIQTLGTGFATSEAFEHLAFIGEPFASPCYIEPPFFRRFFAQDLPAKRAALLNAKQLPANFPILGMPS
jgi:pimeloyl-ACP methyl ester carboxylesterase